MHDPTDFLYGASTGVAPSASGISFFIVMIFMASAVVMFLFGMYSLVMIVTSPSYRYGRHTLTCAGYMLMGVSFMFLSQAMPMVLAAFLRNILTSSPVVPVTPAESKSPGHATDWSQVLAVIGIVVLVAVVLAVVVYRVMRVRKARTEQAARRQRRANDLERANRAQLKGLGYALSIGLVSSQDLRTVETAELQQRINLAVSSMVGSVFDEILEVVGYYDSFDVNQLRGRQKREAVRDAKHARAILREMYDAPARVLHAATMPARHNSLDSGRIALQSVDDETKR